MQNRKQMLLPALVLALVCALCCGLLAVANAVTKDKIAAAEEDAILESLQALPDAGTFREISLDQISAKEPEKTELTGVYVDDHQQAAFLITADGYNKDGIQVIVGVDASGEVTAISFVSLSETPGLGSKLQTNPELLADNLVGQSSSEALGNVDNITGATYSSKGLKRAVQCALDTYAANREAIVS